jgi:cyclic dehypoxanthinyl futalosine synthase
MLQVDQVIEKTLSDERLTPEDAECLLESREFQKIGLAADEMRRRIHPEGVVSFLLDRNINYTNVCVARCTFCNFYRQPNHHEGYLLTKEEIFRKIEQTIAQGGTGILMQGGMNPDLRIEYYEDLLRCIKKKYQIHLHCFSPPEIVVLAKLSKVSIRETIVRLKSAGLDSIPGGGAEILTDRMRNKISPGKCSTDQWLEVMRIAHRENLPTTATMMFGAGETVKEMVEHLERIRGLQDETKGFVAFIPWNVQLEDTVLGEQIRSSVSPTEYLQVLAVSRIYLDNIKNVQVSWLTQGLHVAQIALFFGANDVGSIMMEENVISTAGANYQASESDLVQLIKQAGFLPAQRDSVYRPVNR